MRTILGHDLYALHAHTSDTKTTSVQTLCWVKQKVSNSLLGCSQAEEDKHYSAAGVRDTLDKMKCAVWRSWKDSHFQLCSSMAFRTCREHRPEEGRLRGSGMPGPLHPKEHVHSRVSRRQITRDTLLATAEPGFLLY